MVASDVVASDIVVSGVGVVPDAVVTSLTTGFSLLVGCSVATG
ncbi:hypothetical protein AB0J43_53540 [Nonomuraea fuscirosea]